MRWRSHCSGFAFRRQRSEDRRVRFAHARQKLPDREKVTEVEERSPVYRNFSPEHGNPAHQCSVSQRTED
ncbi:hypothetical protein BES34_016850 [Leptospira inadai serovar Lyme]|uniref:Uncharacterized protein n=1 Tax=Leptospira inadai serovar Lyme TaxID=293084 RepID=A0ABX4YF14_9LEPT|nr:hypothetical protein BES34_016850 [Leptospira inadai serovar Lyme]